MSDNFFDENIKKKLESIQPEYSEAAWKKLKGALPMPWYVPFLKEYGGWIFGGVATVAFLTNYLLNQNLKKENLVLNDKISTLNTQIIEKISIKSDTVFVSKSDTVFLTEFREKEVIRYVKVTDNSGLADESSTQSASKNEKSITKIGVNKNQSVNEPIPLNSSADTQPKASKPTESSTDQSSLVQNEKQDLENEIREAKKPELVFEDSNNQEPKKEKAPVEQAKAVPLLDELKIPEAKQPEKNDKNKFQDFLGKINPRFGVTADIMGSFSNSFGPTIEILPGERLGLNIGLLIGSGDRKNFKLPNDFNSGTGKQFEKRYENFFAEKPSRIENIHIESSSIQMPVYLNYYIPLNYNLGFMLSTGTKLNLNWVEKVSFTGRTLNGTTYIDKFEKQFKPNVFNNLFYGMGIQYQRGRFIGQISPYFEFPFRQGEYLSPPKRFGVNTTIKIAIKK